MHEVIGREVVRGTITRDRWQATVTVIGGDRVPVGATAPLALAIRWRDGGNAAAPPSDTSGVRLELRKRTSSAVGEARFDAVDGVTTKSFSTDTTELLTLFGVTASTGSEDDTLLIVTIDGESRGEIPLAVGAPVVSVAIESVGGGTLPGFLATGHRLRAQATVTPAGAGAYEWLPLDAASLTVVSGADAAEAELEATGAAPSRIICALFTPTGGRPAMAAAAFSPGVVYSGAVEDRSAAPNLSRADTAHRPLTTATPFEVLDGVTVVASGTVDAAGRFTVLLDPAGSYQLRIPGFEGLVP